MKSSFIAVKGDDGLISFTGDTSRVDYTGILKGKYRVYNDVIYRAKENITGTTFNSTKWAIVGQVSGSSITVGLNTDGNITGSTLGTNITLGIANTGVAGGVYNFPQITVDAKGRISAAQSLFAITGITATNGITGNTTGVGAGRRFTFGLQNTSVTPGTYQRAVFTVDSRGRITAASGTTFSGVNGIGVTGNTFGLTRTTVVPGTYQRATITVDERGRLTFVSGNTGSVGGGSPAGINGSIQYNIGGSFAGANSFRFFPATSAVTIGNRSAGVTGATTVTIGSNNIASGARSITVGFNNTNSSINSIAVGQSNTIANSPSSSVFGLSNNVSNATSSFSAGQSNTLTGTSAIALGHNVRAMRDYALATGFGSSAHGSGSFAGGYNASSLFVRPLLSSGIGSFHFGYVDNSQGVSDGALANYSAILGGINNSIASGNVGSVILGGNGIKLTTAGFTHVTAVQNLAIFGTPTTGVSSDSFLTWNSTSKRVTTRAWSSYSNGTENTLAKFGTGNTIKNSTINDSGSLVTISNPVQINGQAWSTMQTLTDAATITWNLNTQSTAEVTLEGTRTLANPTNMKAGGTYFLIVRQDAVGGRNLTFGSAYKWAQGIVPNFSARTASQVDILTFISDGTNMYGVLTPTLA